MRNRMKFFRIAAAICSAAVLAAMPFSASAENLFPGGAEPSNGTTLDGLWEYIDYGDGNISVICKDKTLVNAKIPAQINGRAVTQIDQDCFLENTALESVTIPDTITSIGDWAFSGCTNLKSISLPNSLERISWQAFYNCTALEEITIPAKVDTIDKFVFEGCSALKNIHVSDANTHYTDVDGVLYTYDLNELIRYPSAKEDTFYDVADGCTTIADWAFIGSPHLEEIDMTGVTAIGEDAFYHCTALKSAAVPEGVSELKGSVFGNCTALTSVTLPSTLDKIGDSCFYSCISLPEITIPGRVDTIGNYAFFNCPRLLEITVNHAVKTIGDYALGFCADENDKYFRTPDFVVNTYSDTAAHEYCVRNNIKSTGGVTQSSVFLTVVIIVLVLVIAATVGLILLQKHIQKRYEYR